MDVAITGVGDTRQGGSELEQECIAAQRSAH
jgi:hypothetical protein